MTATLSLRCYTGANAGTESAAQSTITLTDADALSGGDVLPGTLSFERWVRLRVDVAPSLGVANFSLTASGNALPDGVAIRFGVTDTPATPVNTTSAVATKELTPGQKFIFDVSTYAEAGDHTRYLVLQEVVDADAASGAIDPQALLLGWVEK